MKFKWKGDLGDATSNYDVIPSRNCKVREVIDYVISRSKEKREWGSVDIHGPDSFFPMTRVLEFRYGEIVPEEEINVSWYDPDGIMKSENMEVIKIMANGGYSCMSYEIFVQTFPEFSFVHYGTSAGRRKTE